MVPMLSPPPPPPPPLLLIDVECRVVQKKEEERIAMAHPLRLLKGCEGVKREGEVEEEAKSGRSECSERTATPEGG